MFPFPRSRTTNRGPTDWGDRPVPYPPEARVLTYEVSGSAWSDPVEEGGSHAACVSDAFRREPDGPRSSFDVIARTMTDRISVARPEQGLGFSIETQRQRRALAVRHALGLVR